MISAVVFKFGGASVKSAAAVKNVAEIVSNYSSKPILVVVSAMGKMTNALEKLHQLWRNQQDFNSAFEGIKEFHQTIADELGINSSHWQHHCLELEKKLTEPITGSFDKSYDSIVSYGELLSSSILYSYLIQVGYSATWWDVRKIIRTDNRYRDARVDFSSCSLREVQSLGQSYSIAVTQGFIGADYDGNTTTLGREGSDYSASVLAYLAHAREVVIWKDVPGMMNADPRWFSDAQIIPRISFHEAVELAYYGASVIHPKTIKPLQNMGIPLYIKSFENPSLDGTVIHGDKEGENKLHHLILKTSQALVSIAPTDFSFIVEDNLRDIFEALSIVGIRVRLMENSAISFSFVTDDDDRKLEELKKHLEGKFVMRFNRPVTLLTIRHWTVDIVDRYTLGRDVLLEQRNRTSLRLVMRATPSEMIPQKS